MPAKIYLDCERMRYPYTGLYHFCFQLGIALAGETQTDKQEIEYYLPKSCTNIFGDEENYLFQNFTHKYIFPRIQTDAIWHCTFQGTNYYPSKADAKIVLTIHDLNFLYDKKQTEKAKRKQLSRLQYKINKASHIVAISHYVLNDVKKNLFLGEKPVSVIYNGCNIDDSIPLMIPENAPDKPFLFTIGAISEKKNFHVLPALLQNADLYLIIAGIEENPDYVQLIKNEAIRLGVEDRVWFPGAISENDKKWFLSNCEAFVFPSLAEGFGLPVIEAMYFGKAVILSKYTSLPEIGGDCAYYFDNFEAKSMQKVLRASLQHYEKNKPFRKITERALSFSWHTAAKAYVEIYRSLI